MATSPLFCLWITTLTLASNLAAQGTPLPQNPAFEEPTFNRDIRPILADKCFACHGPDGGARKGKLRLDRREDALADRGGYAAILPGDLEESELVYRIQAHPEDRMPPSDWRKSLSQKEIETLISWVSVGAKYEEHWSLVPPVRPDLGQHIASAVDTLLNRKLQAQGLTPAPQADRATLLRRLSFDLIGLPPTPAELKIFVADQKDGAWERQVDRLLASPHFGERMAMGWLDLVRYADTVGYHGDQTHNVSPYRDWVIYAFNENMPFDEFTRMQLAGDILEGAGDDGLIASCYNRLLQSSHEGGVQLKEYAAIYSADRVRNFGSVWLGLTVGCAQCHDHKFDPIEQRDFYQIAAFFADIDDRGHLRKDSGRNTNPTPREPEVDVLSPLDRQEVLRLETMLAELPEGESAERSFLESRKAAIQPRRVMVSNSTTPREVRVLNRGDWMDESGEVVEPAVLSALKQLQTSETRASREDLANWLMEPDQPLTARVFVNRLWRQFFGRGLSRILDNLGSQGAWPDHPELLDWLAVEFRESGWDNKHMVRLIVTSEAYQRSSTPTAKSLELDPDNIHFGRQNRWRLEAELIRDQALAVSGLLVSRIGGTSGLPYQPVGYYEHLNFPKRKYKAANGEQQYRRGVYTHWQRTFLHPAMLAFDAPTREECSAERPISNTPAAALALLNDPSFVEAARAFAQRALLEGGTTDFARLEWIMKNALGRTADKKECSLLKNLLAEHRRQYQNDPQGVEALLAVGDFEHDPLLKPDEIAAWTSVTRTVLNLHESISRL